MGMKRSNLILSVVLAGYLLGVHNGKIALWKGEDPQPVRIFPYEASMLPAKDQEALQQGIPIENRSELIRLLEDYLS